MYNDNCVGLPAFHAAAAFLFAFSAQCIKIGWCSYQACVHLFGDSVVREFTRISHIIVALKTCSEHSLGIDCTNSFDF